MIVKESNSISHKDQKILCKHCGDVCKDDSITLSSYNFCCEGCKTVYSILSENGMEHFYKINDKAGISQRANVEQKYDYLDEKLTIEKLISYQDDELTKVDFYLPAIHCSSCLWLLENLHRLNNHILSARVDFIKKQVLITFRQDGISLRQLVELLSTIGYPPHIILHDLEKQNNQPSVDRSLIYKLGVAGFVFGNIMLFSFPEYLGLSQENDPMLSKVFSYLNVALSIPLVAYSGIDYLKSAFYSLKQKHLNIDVPVSLGILALFFRSLFEIFSHTGAGYLDSLAGLIFFLLAGRWFQQKTFSQIKFDRDFRSYFPIACTVLQDNKEIQMTLDKLQVGDFVLIRHGELIPADALLMEGEAKVDYSFVTGESRLVDKQVKDHLYAGGRQMGGLIKIKILKSVSNSYLTQLWNEQTFKENKEGQTSKIAEQVAKFFTSTILLVSFFALIYWLPVDVSKAINAFTAVLIVACPCAVALSIPFTFGNALRILASKGIYLRNAMVIESLAQMQHFVFDKTGTITNIRSSRLNFNGSHLTEEEQTLIYSLSRHSTHPLSRQIEKLYNYLPVLEVSEFMEEKGKGISGFVNGHLVRIGSARFIGVENLNEKNEDGLYIEMDDIVKGSFQQNHAYREGLRDLIKSLEKSTSVSLITGDNSNEEVNLKNIFNSKSQLKFNQKPVDKLNYIKALQSQNKAVAMIGDGLNDAGALKQSDVGIVISEDTSNFTPACDIIMDSRQFSMLNRLYEYSKLNISVVKISYAIALVYNIIGLSFAVQAILSPVIAAILMPLSSITIVLFGVGASTYYAKKLNII